MKNLRLTLGIAAIAIGSIAAFSFAPEKVDVQEATGVYYSNPDGSMSNNPVVGTSDCDNAPGNRCSQEYDLETGEPTNNPAFIKTGHRP